MLDLEVTEAQSQRDSTYFNVPYNPYSTTFNQTHDISELIKALCQVQGAIQDVRKDSEGFGYKYADLGQILDTVRPLRFANGLVLTQGVYTKTDTQFMDGKTLYIDRVGICSRLMHVSGQWMESHFDIQIEPHKKMSMTQCIGSAITYMRKYAECAIMGLTQVDDDGISSAPSVKTVDDKTLQNIIDLMTVHKVSDNEVNGWLTKANVKSLSQLPPEPAEKILKYLSEKPKKEVV